MTASSLPPLAAAVSQDRVRGLMAGRLPRLTDEGDDRYNLFVETIRGVTARVAPLVGSVTEGPRWDLGVQAVAVGAAASIEASLYPEQQGLGNSGLWFALNAQFEAVIKQLEGSIDGDGGAGTSSTPTPLGRFPDAEPYPDPVRRRYPPLVIWP